MRHAEPHLFARAAELEATLNARRAALGKDPIYLTRHGRPLAAAIPAGADPLPFDDPAGGGCDSGWCAT
jgi:hypothetical protein